jgi:hypothetical protein
MLIRLYKNGFFLTLGKRQIKKSFKLIDSPMSGSPKQKDLNKRTESIDSNEISMEIEDNTKGTSEMVDKMRHLYNLLVNQTDPERDIIEPFMTVPCKKTYPDYYNFIKNPINLVIIDERISSNYYKTMKKFRSDVNLMFENCKSYNESDSLLHQDACKLQKIFNKVRYSYLFAPSQKEPQYEIG